MSCLYRARCRWRVMILAGFLVTGSACAIVVHPGNSEPNLVSWTDRPVDDVIGRWGQNASCVAISPNCVITTRHQGGGVGTVVEIAGGTFRVEHIWNHPGVKDPQTGEYGAVDLRIARLEGADLREYAKFYTDSNEEDCPGCVVIGGWGLGRGEPLKSLGVTYGYAWQASPEHGNRTLRWCTNQIDFARDNIRTNGSKGQADNYHSYVVADFDDPGTTLYEGALAEFDSGGGWFMKTADRWELVGLNWGVEHAESKETWFRLASNPGTSHADQMYGLRMSAYSPWADYVIENECSGPLEGDYSGDCVVDIQDLAEFAAWWLQSGCGEANANCQGRDLDGSKWVDLADLAIFGGNFGMDNR